MDFKLKNISEIRGTCYIEFNIAGSIDKYAHWQDDSKYLYDEAAYNLFTDIFEQYTDRFNYYGPTMFTTEQVENIRKDVEIRSRQLGTLITLQELIDFSILITDSANPANELEYNYEQLNSQIGELFADIRELGRDMTEFLTRCVEENKILWVLGL